MIQAMSLFWTSKKKKTAEYAARVVGERMKYLQNQQEEERQEQLIQHCKGSEARWETKGFLNGVRSMVVASRLWKKDHGSCSEAPPGSMELVLLKAPSICRAKVPVSQNAATVTSDVFPRHKSGNTQLEGE